MSAFAIWHSFSGPLSQLRHNKLLSVPSRSYRERNDFGYDIDGYTLHKGVALYKSLRSVFKYEVQGSEQIQGQDRVVVTFEQILKCTDTPIQSTITESFDALL